MILSVSVIEILLLCGNFNCTNCILLVLVNLSCIDVYFKFTFAIQLITYSSVFLHFIIQSLHRISLIFSQTFSGHSFISAGVKKVNCESVFRVIV